MKPRNYGTFNRIIARSVTHAINDYYSRKPKQKVKQTDSNNQDFNILEVAFIGFAIFLIIALFV